MNSYDKLNRIGEGAYGTVYRAIDKQTNNIVALKKVGDRQTDKQTDRQPASGSWHAHTSPGLTRTFSGLFAQGAQFSRAS